MALLRLNLVSVLALPDQGWEYFPVEEFHQTALEQGFRPVEWVYLPVLG